MDRLQGTWKNKFNAPALDRGESIYRNGRVVELKQNEDSYSAAVLERQRYEVSLSLQNRLPVRMRCHCPISRSGNNCYHMAALLFAIDALDHPEKYTQTDKEDSSSLQPKITRGTKNRNKRETQKSSVIQTKGEPEKRTRKTKHQKESELELLKKEKEEQAKKKEAERRAKEEAQRLVKEEAEQAAKKEVERLAKEEAERAERRAAREKRKAARAKKETEQKAAAQAERQKQLEKQLAEEQWREALRQQKKAETQRRQEKRR